jgi:putative phosphoesterase
MRIGLIADTHVRDPRQADLGAEVADVLRGSDLIFHLGDVYCAEVLDWLELFAPVYCAEGNGDPHLRGDRRVKRAHVLELCGLKVGLLHGYDYPEPPWRSLESAMETEFGGPVDVMLFGDTHVAVAGWCKGVLLVNPGSPTIPNGLPDMPGTLGILSLGGPEPRAEIVKLTRVIPLAW